MLRVLALTVLLVMPRLVFADALEAAALGQLVPVLLGILLVALLLLVAGVKVARDDFASARTNPRPVSIFLLLMALILGIYMGSVFTAINKNRSGGLNLLTQIYVPLTVFLIALKQIRGAQRQLVVVWWTGVVASALLTLVAAVTNLVVSSSRYAEPESPLNLALVFLVPVVWYMVFKRLNRPQTVLSDVSTPTLLAWWTPLAGASLAVAYDTLLQVAQRWLGQSMRPNYAQALLPTEFVRLQVICFALYLVFGVFLLLITSWQPVLHSAKDLD